MRALSSPMWGPPCCKSRRVFFQSTLKFGWWPDLVDLSLGGVLQLLPRHFGDDPLMAKRFRTTRAFFFLVFLVFLEVRDCLVSSHPSGHQMSQKIHNKQLQRRIGAAAMYLTACFRKLRAFDVSDNVTSCTRVYLGSWVVLCS